MLQHLKKISILCLFSCSISTSTNKNEDEDAKMMRACEQYILNYKPLYVMEKDTFSVARFNFVPDSINNYLIECAKSKNFKPLKYSAALVIRQHHEYLIENNQEYLLMEALTQKNGFIVLLRQAMKIGDVDDNYTNIDYFTIFSGEVCKWINDNKSLISDYKFVEKQKKKYKQQIQFKTKYQFMSQK